MSETYVGRKACGCVVAATVIDPENLKDTAKDVAGFIREGLSIEKVSTEAARTLLHSCPHRASP